MIDKKVEARLDALKKLQETKITEFQKKIKALLDEYGYTLIPRIDIGIKPEPVEEMVPVEKTPEPVTSDTPPEPEKEIVEKLEELKEELKK